MEVPKTVGEGDLPQLLPLVYDELRRLARARLAHGIPDDTLTPTELVHEAYLRVVADKASRFESRRHFFFSICRAMHDITVESARRRASLKRGGEYLRVDLDRVEIAFSASPESVLDLNRALAKLRQQRPELAQMIQLRYFAGLAERQVATAMKLSQTTVKRRWRFARAWLLRELAQQPGVE